MIYVAVIRFVLSVFVDSNFWIFTVFVWFHTEIQKLWTLLIFSCQLQRVQQAFSFMCHLSRIFTLKETRFVMLSAVVKLKKQYILRHE